MFPRSRLRYGLPVFFGVIEQAIEVYVIYQVDSNHRVSLEKLHERVSPRCMTIRSWLAMSVTQI